MYTSGSYRLGDYFAESLNKQKQHLRAEALALPQHEKFSRLQKEIDQTIQPLFENLSHTHNREAAITLMVSLQYALMDAFLIYYQNPLSAPDNRVIINACASGIQQAHQHFLRNHTGHISRKQSLYEAASLILGAFVQGLVVQYVENHNTHYRILHHQEWMDQYHHTDIALYHLNTQTCLLIDVKTSAQYPPVTFDYETIPPKRLQDTIKKDNQTANINAFVHMTINPLFGTEYNVREDSQSYKALTYETINHNIHHIFEWIHDTYTRP